MAGDFEDLMKEIQERIFQDTRDTYGKQVFERWLQPKHFGKMPNATVSARITGSCGESMEIYLHIENDTVKGASFFTDGCGASMACGSAAAELAVDRTLDEIVLVGEDMILEMLGGLPEDHRHCAMLAAETLQTAVHNYLIGSQIRK
ncbi:MAG: iron-sulfur cluster assembly scaffold protein [Desulforhabdus sp.]|jgi:nitrogen fixation NifU-like protein|nr:iron-sulfur cluster assembly scaffold protein [Desulforhabdus sp.]